MAARKPRLTEPLETITLVIGIFLAASIALGLGNAVLHKGGEFYAFGVQDLCATNTHIGVGTTPSARSDHVYTAKPGAWLNDNSALNACTSHPTSAQRVLYTLTSLPSFLLYAGIIVLLWFMIREARRNGPFSTRVAARMRLTGWFVILGAMAAAAVHELASGMLMNTLLITKVPLLPDAATAPIGALFPAPVIAGCALLTFARVIRFGSAMDDEIKATI